MSRPESGSLSSGGQCRSLTQTAASISVNCDNMPLWENRARAQPASNWATWGQTCDTMCLVMQWDLRALVLSDQTWSPVFAWVPSVARPGQTQWVTLILTEHSLTVTSRAWAWAAWLSQATSVSQASPLQPICNTQNTENTVWLSVSSSF